MAPHPSGTLPPHVRPLSTDDPARIGDHRLIGRLGDNGVGVVYAAVSPGGEPVALTVAHAPWAPAADPERRLVLLRRGLGTCAVGVSASGDLHGRPWTAVPYLPGADLGRHVRETGPLPEPALLVLAAGTAEALAAVHAAGVPHGDVRPGNVLVTPQGPRLLDHGVARQLDDGDAPTTAGGTGWLAPERYAGARPDPASDVFSWACVVVLAATGREPFGADASPPEVARRAREGTADLAAVPVRLRPVLSRALSPDPARRPSAEELYLECLLLAGVEDSAPHQVWAERLRTLTGASWPRVDVGWHRPAEWISAALGLAEHEPADAADPDAAAPGGPGRGDGRSRASLRRRKAFARRPPVLAVAAAVFLAAAVGGGYLLLDALAGESDTTAANSSTEPPGSTGPNGQSGQGTGPAEGDGGPGTAPPTGMDLVAASLDTLLAAESFELTLLTHAGSGRGYGQPLPANTAATPTLFDRVLYQEGPPRALRWTSTVSGARTSDLWLVDGQLLRGANTAWNGPPTWYAAEPEVRGAAEAFTPERVLEPLARVVENGTVTGEGPVVFTAPPTPEDAYGHLGGQAPDEVPAVLVEGEFSALASPEGETTAFTLVATEDGTPLAFATEGAPSGGYVLSGRPVSEGVPVSFLAPDAPEPALWYTRYTFVEINGEPDPDVPDPDQVRAEGAPAPPGT
ncbi:MULTISPECIES: protein kinase [unclassified Nocardiopsis]|uniref:serine/threonine protein kinase n=1 Tax=unclassified Nocardiopsis TaxID=2649073 RepID=UPI00135915BF|nr:MULTISPECIES: protein kinase [unclassified Nocardiopsis]